MAEDLSNSVGPAWQDQADTPTAMLTLLLSRAEFSDVVFRVGTARIAEDIKAHR